MNENKIAEIVAEIGVRFRTFGGGFATYGSEPVVYAWNPIADALKERPLQFAAGVDVAEVVRLVLRMANDRKDEIVAMLLAACRALVRETDGPGEFGEALKAARAAITKATGTSLTVAVDGEADARLISAAPDLLAALERVLCPGGGWNGMPEHLVDRCTVRDCLDADVCGCDLGVAVAKATGGV